MLDTDGIGTLIGAVPAAAGCAGGATTVGAPASPKGDGKTLVPGK
jgi:hypothetical protein